MQEKEQLILEITQEDLDNSSKAYFSSGNCPAAMAAKRLFNNPLARSGGDYVRNTGKDDDNYLYQFSGSTWNEDVFIECLNNGIKESIRLPLIKCPIY